jgi:uncharacterized protein YdaU (DUF1376 family)
MHFYKHYISDYTRKTVHLSLYEHGAYFLLLQHYYSIENASELTQKIALSVCRVRTKKETQTVIRVLDEFFPIGADGKRHNDRADQELAVYLKRVEFNRSVGKLGGRPPKNNNPDGFQNITQTVPENNPSQKSEVRKKIKSIAGYSPAFDLFWQTWPNSERKQAKGKCFETWKRLGLDEMHEEIIAHVKFLTSKDSWNNGYIPAPLVYLNQRRWEGAELSIDPDEPERRLAL